MRARFYHVRPHKFYFYTYRQDVIYQEEFQFFSQNEEERFKNKWAWFEPSLFD